MAFDSTTDFSQFHENWENNVGTLRTPFSQTVSSIQVPFYDSTHPIPFPSLTSPTTNTPSGLFPNLWNDIKSGASSIWHHAEGGLTGAWNALANPNDLPDQQLGIPVIPMVKGFFQGLVNPDQAMQQEKANEKALGVDNSGLYHFVENTATDPLSYVPLSLLTKPLGIAAKAGYNAVKDVPAVSSLIDKITSAGNSLSDWLKEGWNRMHSTNAVESNQYINKIQNSLQGLTPEEQIAALHIAENAPIAEKLREQMPHVVPAANQIRILFDKLGEEALNRGLIKSMRENYVSHIPVSKFENGGIFANSTKPLKPYLSSSKARKLEGTIYEINQRAANGELDDVLSKLGLEPGSKLFEDNPAKLLTAHALQVIRAKNLYDFIHNVVLPNAQKVTEIPAVIPKGMGLYRPNTLKFFPAMLAEHNIGEDAVNGLVPLEELHPGVGVSSKTPAYLMNKADAEFLNGAFRSGNVSNLPPLVSGALNLGKKALAGINTAARTTMLYNPLVHTLNNVPWQVFLKDAGVLNPLGERGWLRFLNEAKNGPIEGSMYERAAKAGAISAPHTEFRGGIHDIANQVAESLNPTKTPWSVLKKYNPVSMVYRASNAATWIPEHAMRANLFSRLVDRGLSDEEAAKEVNSVLGNYNNLGKVEKGIQTYAFPFWNWMRTAIPSNIKALYEQTPKFAIPYHAIDTLNYMATGHGMSENPENKRWAIAIPGVKDKNGNQFYFSWYNPGMELGKLSTEGLDYFFRRLNPVDKMAYAALTNQEDPFQDYKVVPYPDIPGGASNPLNEKGIFFGNKGPRVNPWLAYAAQTFGNPVSGIGEAAGATLPENIARLVGSYGSYYNPETAAREQQYKQRQQQSELRAALKAFQKYQQGQ
jgi:hypothetical protein